ncbi:sigma 54-interacting transcriptional regulator [bacterium]|nr:sigma 54-interacting transcriptional regulator [bacterium]
MSLVLFLLLAPSQLFGQSYLTHTYTELDGLPANQVRGVTQTRDGRIWIATRNGIANYNGINWYTFPDDNRPPITDFHFIKADERDRVWAVSRGVRVYVNENNRWRSLPQHNLSTLTPLTFNACDFSIVDGQDVMAIATTADGLHILKDEEWKHIYSREGLVVDTVGDLMFHDGYLLLATAKGILSLDEKTFEPVESVYSKLVLPTSFVTGFAIEYMKAPDLRGTNLPRRLWITGDTWMGSIEQHVFVERKPFLSPVGINKYWWVSRPSPDYGGGLIYGNQNVLYHLDAFGNLNYFNKSANVESEGAYAIFVDREYCIWLAGGRGLSKIPSMRFCNYTQADGMLEDDVASISWMDENRLLLGHNSGYSIYDHGSITAHPFTIHPAAPNQITRILDIERIDSHSYWLAINSAGMYHLELRGEDDWYSYPFDDRNIASAVEVDDTGKLIVASGMGLLAYSPDEDKFVYDAIDKTEDIFVRVIEKGANGELYLGSGDEGVIEINNGRRRYFSSEESPAANNIFSIYPQTSGDVLVGTYDGLFHIQNDKLERFLPDQPFGRRPSYFINRDRDGRLWLGTDNGIFIWDGSQSIHYTRIHGLAGMEANRKGFYVDRTGSVWIGTSSGLSRYERRYDFTQRIPLPEIAITEVRGGGRSFAEGVEAEFNSNDNTVSFVFSFVSMLDESRNEFRYWLEGASDGWTPPQPLTSNTLRFSNLPPGKYRLHLEACNALGKWSGQTTSEMITILPPFWRTWWFLFLMLVTLISTMILIYRLFLQQRYSTLLRTEVQEKTAELIHHRDRLEEIVQQRTSELSLSNEALRGEITKREVVQQEVERHHTHLMSIFNGVHDAIVTVDADGVITKANQGFSQLFQLGESMVEGGRLVDFVPIDDVLKAVEEGRDVRGAITEVTDRTTGELLLKINAQPLPFENKESSEIMVVMSDVTRLYHLEKEVADRKSYHNIIGQNPKMQAIYSMIEDLATTLATVLITGESGTGKELVASALHHSSIRAEGPFIALNCAALSETILESELFGHVKGAFTSAVRDRAGRFEAARGGTLFLDEIGEMPMNMQVKLLRVLETGEFERVGDTVTLKTDARIISATNRDLLKRVEEGEFRKDLYYRLNVIHLHLPPLRERAEDIPLLTRYFVQMFAEEADPPVTGVSPETLELLINSKWPGNVRELKHQVQRACLICREGTLQPSHFRELVRSTSSVTHADTSDQAKVSPGSGTRAATNGTNENGGKAHRAPEKDELLASLEQHEWNIQQTANDLGLSRQTIYRKIKEFNLKRPLD